MADVETTTPTRAIADQLGEAEYSLNCIAELLMATGDAGLTMGSAEWLGEQIEAVAVRVGDARQALRRRGITQPRDADPEAGA